MHPILLDHNSTTLNAAFYALAMRSAYIFTDGVAISGEHMWTYNNLNTLDTYSFRDKVVLLLTVSKDEDLEKMQEAEKILKTFRCKKRLNAQEIVFQRKMQKYVELCFDLWIARAAEWFYNTLGFMKVERELLKTKAVSLFDYSIADAEDGTAPLSEILTGTLISDDEAAADQKPLAANEGELSNSLWMLPDEFFEWCHGRHTIYNAANAEATGVQNIYLHPCFMAPVTTALSTEEMRLSRRTMKPHCMPWLTAADKWMTAVWNAAWEHDNSAANGDLKTDAESAFTEMLTHAETLQQAIDQNPLLHHAKRSRPANEYLQVMLGEVPLEIIYAFYRETKVMPDNTWEKVQEALSKSKRKHYRDPVMAIQFHGEKYFKDTGEKPAPPLLTLKKSLKVD